MNKRICRKTGMKIMKLIFLMACFMLFAGFVRVNNNQNEIVIGLIGDQMVELSLGEEYIDEGIFASENGIDVKSQVTIVDEVDMDTKGEYEILYIYKNITITRTVKVNPTKSYLQLNGDKCMNLFLGEDYLESGVLAYNEDGEDVTDKVVIQGAVETDVLGQYVLEYSFVNRHGIKIQVNRTIDVLQDPMKMTLAEFNLLPLFEDTMIKETIMDQTQIDEYLDETLFIGDSRNCSLLWYGFLPKSNVFGTESLTPLNISYKKIKRFDKEESDTTIKMIQKYQPKRVVFTLGIDSVGTNSPEYIVSKYQEFLLELQKQAPDTHIVINNILPVGSYMDLKDKRNWAPTNDKINKVNFHIAKMCRQLNISYLNSAYVLKDERGLGDEAYFNKDHMHLSKKGQELIYNYILSHPVLD